MALRLGVYDRTERGRGPLLGLSHVWGAGSSLYRGTGKLDHTFGAASWEEALAWLGSVAPGQEVAEVQFWGHGNWGSARVHGEKLDEAALDRGHRHHDALLRVRDRLSGPEALWWFRTCETFGADPGQRFAARFADLLGCKVAGHTYIIAFWQSGLHLLEPGAVPHWSTREGLAQGTPAAPERALWSGRRQPCTVTCLTSAVPPSW
jgi:hypothetical protein